MYILGREVQPMSPKVDEDYKRNRKTELLKAATRVFIKQGYAQTTMQDIMNEAGVSRGAFYSYFENIEHVFIEVLKYDDEQDVSFFVPPQESLLWPHLEQWVMGQQIYIEAIDQTLVNAKSQFFLSSKYARSKETYPYIADRYNKLAETIEKVLVEGMVRGEIAPLLSTHSISRYIISFMDGLMLDTFQLGYEQTKVKDQLSVHLLALEKILNPINKK